LILVFFLSLSASKYSCHLIGCALSMKSITSETSLLSLLKYDETYIGII
jgi:hypothetical protein